MTYGWLGQHQRPYEHAGALSLVEMGACIYSPLLGRFLQADPGGGGRANDYDYVNADPINGKDLTGERSHYRKRHVYHRRHHVTRRTHHRVSHIVQRRTTHHTAYRLTDYHRSTGGAPPLPLGNSWSDCPYFSCCLDG